MNPRSKEAKIFLLGHVVVLLVVLFGFGRTFYLRSVFISQPLPLAAQLHGIALTLWFTLVAVQGGLVVTGQRQWHVKLAWLAIPVIAFAVASGLWINSKIVLRLTSTESPENAFVWGNYLSLLSFVILVAAGVVYRRRFITHHRLVFFASVTILGPALARFPPIFGISDPAAVEYFAGGGTMLLMACVVAYDLLTYRRVKWATLIGIAGAVLPQLGGSAIAASGVGFALFH